MYQTIWLRYAEFEMRSKFPNHARNVWDRAVALLPRVDQFWYKYSYMEVCMCALCKKQNPAQSLHGGRT